MPQASCRVEAGMEGSWTGGRGSANSPWSGVPRVWHARANGTTWRGSTGFTANGREEGSASSVNWIGGGIGGRASGATGRGGADEGKERAFFLL